MISYSAKIRHKEILAVPLKLFEAEYLENKEKPQRTQRNTKESIHRCHRFPRLREVDSVLIYAIGCFPLFFVAIYNGRA